MRRAILSAVLLLLALASQTAARLVPVPVTTQPEIQRLTRSEAIARWGYEFFGQCHGVAIAPLIRLACGDSVPLALAVSDPLRHRIVFGQCYEKEGTRGYDWFTLESPRRPDGRMCLSLPLGMAFDTVRYQGSASQVYLYVACAASASVPRLRMDLAGRTLGYVDDVYSTMCGIISDVCCCAASPTSSFGTYVALVNSFTARVTILGIDRTTMLPTVVAELGQPGGGTGEFREPEGVCITQKQDASGITYDVYVADRGNSRVVRLTLDPALQELVWRTSYAVPGALLQDVTVNRYGFVYAVDGNGRVVALDAGLTELMYTYDECGFDNPMEITIFGDELVVCENWSDSTGIQYLRIVPEVKFLDGGGLFDATRDSSRVRLLLNETDAYVDVDIRRGPGAPQRHLVADSLLSVADTHHFHWDGRTDDGPLALPAEYDVRATASFRRNESDPRVVDIAWAETRIKGTQVSGAESGVWDTVGSPYVLTGDVTVPKYSTLRVESGVWVMPAGQYGITVEGALISKGEQTDRIHYTPYRKIAAEPAGTGHRNGVVVPQPGATQPGEQRD